MNRCKKWQLKKGYGCRGGGIGNALTSGGNKGSTVVWNFIHDCYLKLSGFSFQPDYIKNNTNTVVRWLLSNNVIYCLCPCAYNVDHMSCLLKWCAVRFNEEMLLDWNIIVAFFPSQHFSWMFFDYFYVSCLWQTRPCEISETSAKGCCPWSWILFRTQFASVIIVMLLI